MEEISWRQVQKLQDRAGLWTTRSLAAYSKGDYNRAGRLKTKSIQLSNKANNMIEKLRNK